MREKMSAIQMLRAFVTQRLAAAVEDIFGLLEATIADYEREIHRQRGLLEGVPPGYESRKADARSLSTRKEGKESRTTLDQEDPDPSHIKELWSSWEGEQLQALEEDHVTKFPFTVVSVKSEDEEEKAQISPIRQRQTEESGEAEPPACSSAQQMETETDSGHQLLPSYCCDSETEDSHDDWKEKREQESGSDTLKNKTTLNHIESQDRPFSCTVCDKRFGCKGNLRAHMRSHTGEKPFTCTVCDKGFSTKVNLQTHMRSHTGEKPFSCSMCNKSFTQKKTLVIHLRIHTGEKPFSCSFCGKRFGEKGTLRRHIRVHTGEKPYSCGVCGRNFSLLSHVKSHKCAGASGEK